MNLHCARCSSQTLGDAPHGAASCPNCGGVFVPAGRLGEFAADPPTAAAGIGAEGSAVRCPADGAIMSRARVDLAGGGAVALDRCGSCRGIWFDAGEWTALASAHLLEHLPEFWTAEWRNRQRRDSEHARHEARLREELGAELYEQIMALAHKLRSHPRRSEALAILREESSGH